MGAPNLSFTFTRGKISDEPGFDCIAVTFSADAPYQAFECRAQAFRHICFSIDRCTDGWFYT